MSNILDKLHITLGKKGLLKGDDAHQRPTGFFNPAPNAAKAIARPATTEEVANTIKLCLEKGQTIVPAGGCTGLADGHTANQEELQLSLERMNAIEEIDPVNRTITVQAGATLEAVQNAADAAGFYYPIDFGGRGSATIGGTIATNAGGNSVLRYGMTREQVLGLEVVLANGDIFNGMTKLVKDNAGYNLKHLFIGSEGTLGIITRTILRLSPKNQSKNTALIATNSFDDVSKTFNALNKRLSDTLTSFEVMWSDFYNCVLTYGDTTNKPLPNTYPYYILVETEGFSPDQDREQFELALGELLETEAICDAVIAESGQQRESLWAIRDSIEATLRYMPSGIAYDISLPLDYIESYRNKLKAALSEIDPDYKMVTFGHLGDNNVHMGIEINPQIESFIDIQKEIIYSCLQGYSASVSAEHGIGEDKKKYIHYCRDDVAINLMKTLRKALDPNAILNPRKITDHSR